MTCRDGGGLGCSVVTCCPDHTLLFLCPSAQIQVVDDGSSATSPDTPESGLARILRQKGECEPQLCFKFICFKQCKSKLIITMDNNSSFVSFRHPWDSQNNQAGRQPLLALHCIFYVQSNLCIVSLMCLWRWLESCGSLSMYCGFNKKGLSNLFKFKYMPTPK